MAPPSGEQFELRAAGYRAVVTETGATLRVLEYDGRPLVDGFAEDELCHGGRGQLLMPWPGRVQDGTYTFGGSEHRLPLTEPELHNASHGLVRWVSWSVEEHTTHSVSLVYRLPAQPGYPWSLDLQVSYDLSADGLTVTQTATNLSDSPAPYACGAHPYLAVGQGPIDTWELTLPASRRTLVDPDRLLPIGSEPVDDTDYDFRIARPIKDTVFNHAFTDLERDEFGQVSVVLEGDRDGLTLWADEHVRWLQVFSADPPYGGRRSLAIEPMTAQANALRTGEDLVTLAPSGEPGDDLSVSWGIRVN